MDLHQDRGFIFQSASSCPLNNRNIADRMNITSIHIDQELFYRNPHQINLHYINPNVLYYPC